MKLDINDKIYNVEPYACSPSNEFPFYINVTNVCNAKCKFCSNGLNNNYGKLNLKELEHILDQVYTKISRFSISGGEPLINIDELDKLLSLLIKYDRRITINTNGCYLLQNIKILNKYPIESIQLSRHHYDDNKNNEVFGVESILHKDIKKIKLKADLRINCLLIKGYIDNKEEVVKFLEHISKSNISQVGFISMMKVNDYAKDNFIDYRDIINDLNNELLLTNKMCDNNRCSCNNYMYIATNGKPIFVYFRNTEKYQEGGRSLYFDCNGLKEGY
jgi:molybdenum cofactor biosynthesis enzyme MoaA